MFSTKYNSEKKIWRGVDMYSPLFHDNVTTGRAILYALSLSPEKVCQINADDGSKRTNKQIHDATLKIAYNLQQLGCVKGDVIGFVCRNTHDLTPAILAALFLSTPVNVLDTTFPKEEIAHIFRIVKPKVVFCDDHVVECVQMVLRELHNQAKIFVLGQRVPDLGHIEDLMVDNGKQADIQNLLIHPPEVDRDSCAAIICSSGTTGFSKGVAVSHENMQQIFCRPYLKQVFQSDDLIFSFNSLYWYAGYVSMLTSLFLGLPRLIMRESFSPERFIEIMQKHRVAFLIIPSPHTKQLVKGQYLKDDILANVKTFVTTGDFVSLEVAQKIKSLLSIGVLHVLYGLTETSRISCNLYPASDRTVGKLEPGVFAKIVDEEGKQLGVGETGELFIKTATEFLGYYNNQEATKELRDTDGWIMTGDYAYFNDDGCLTITGRKKHMLKYNNIHVSPTELEQILEKHPGVLRAVVVGIPDPVFMDLPAAVILCKKGSSTSAEDLVKWVDDRVMNQKRLRGGVYFTSELPTTPTGKVKITLVKEFAIKMFNAKTSEQ